ncbi:hypothetical protein GCM10023086_76160 [Streptomyces venetus]|uniref:Uncharacterized protein n=1 Tax=Streptomyces venetus TaxID=1701086 RepID=A0ABP8HKH3_9ACTN
MPDAAVVSAADATPAPNATETPRPAASTVARVRNWDVREERDVTRWDIETSRGRGRRKPPDAQSLAEWPSLGNPKSDKHPKA